MAALPALRLKMQPASLQEKIARARAKTWFYPYRLPDGGEVATWNDGRVNAIHTTRSAMLDACLAETFGGDTNGLTAVDLACHQGWFSVQLARQRMREVVAVDARTEHVEDTKLIADVLELPNIRTLQSDIFALDRAALGEFDVVLMFGLLYHLENPVGALRLARALTRRLFVIETQVVPNMSGPVDWGSYQYVRPLKGVFGIIDEMDETHGAEASITGVCLAPSVEGLLWIMHSVGFSQVQVLPVPEDGYEQLRYGKRVMVAGRVA
jgi:hypothetical protein